MILDVATGDPRWAQWSASRIAEALDAGRVVISPLIYAEVSVGHRSAEELDDLLPASDYEREPLPYRAGFAAGKAYLRYRQSGGGKRSAMPDFISARTRPWLVTSCSPGTRAGTGPTSRSYSC